MIYNLHNSQFFFSAKNDSVDILIVHLNGKQVHSFPKFTIESWPI